MNAAGLALLEESEGCELTTYQDAAGVWTIGYGHTAGVEPGQTITQQEANDFLEADLQSVCEAVQVMCEVELTPNQFSALVDFAYNVGTNALASSTLMRLVNNGDFNTAANQFERWVFANGQALPGLVTRRQREKELFLTP
jgi:lysozyme